MAVFSRSDKSPIQSTNSAITVIADGSKIEGVFNMECKFHIDGEVKGKVFSSNIITIGIKGVLRGDVKADKLMVSGLFEGNVDCTSIEILAGGSVRGKVISKEFVIEPEGNFEGESRLKRDDIVSEEKEEVETKRITLDNQDVIDDMIEVG